MLTADSGQQTDTAQRVTEQQNSDSDNETEQILDEAAAYFEFKPKVVS